MFRRAAAVCFLYFANISFYPLRACDSGQNVVSYTGENIRRARPLVGRASHKMDKILEKLNPEQIKPVLDTEGAVLVLAGAGSGKTRVLTSRIAYLVEEKGVYPSSVLAITFTNKAAKEMKERLSRMVDGAEKMWICTIHSMCVRILRQYAERIGYNKNFSIYSETERNNVIKKSFAECGETDEKLLKNVKFHIANAKTLGLAPEAYAEKNRDVKNIGSIERVYAAYQAHLKAYNALDFDDLLTETLRLLETDKDALEYLSGRFRYIHVDEFQDTNRVQYEIVRLLSSVHGNLFCVGDDDQSIYGWRGAKIENILEFEKDFKGAKVYKLEQNYRSTKNILKLANSVIKNNGRRKEKELWTENGEGAEAGYFQAATESDEALYVARTISDLMRTKDYDFSDFAVLMRINALTRSFEQEFSKYNIPFKVFGGFRFYERREIKDLLAYLRIINNPFDSEAAVRVINVPKRGIGAKTVETLEAYAEQTGLSVYDAVLAVDELPLTAGSRQKVKAFGQLLKSLVIKGAEEGADELDVRGRFRREHQQKGEHRRICKFRGRVLQTQQGSDARRLFESGNAELGYRRDGRERIRDARDHSFGQGVGIQNGFRGGHGGEHHARLARLLRRR